MKKINVLYTINHEYFKHMLVSLYSLLEHNEDIKFDIHIIFENLSSFDLNYIEVVMNEFPNSNVTLYDYSEYKDILKNYKLPDWRGCQISNARLFFQKIINVQNNLLYLDSDTIIVDSIKDIEKYTGAINMVQDAMSPTHWKRLDSNLKKYFNSGVLWINIDKWINEKCEDKILKTINLGYELKYPDQDILNLALKDDITTLPSKYNVFPLTDYLSTNFLYRYYKDYKIEGYSKDEIADSKKNPIILHSTGFFGLRPWDNDSIHPHARLYNDYYYKVFNDRILLSPLTPEKVFLNKMYLYLKLSFPKELRENVKKLIRHKQD